jgi:hypothetical protein
MRISSTHSDLRAAGHDCPIGGMSVQPPRSIPQTRSPAMLFFVTKLLSLFGTAAFAVATSPLVSCCPAGGGGSGGGTPV